MRNKKNVIRGSVFGIIIIIVLFLIFFSGKPVKEVLRSSRMENNVLTNRLLGMSFNVPQGWEDSLKNGPEIRDGGIYFLSIKNPNKMAQIDIFAGKPKLLATIITSKMYLNQIKAEANKFEQNNQSGLKYVLKEDIKAVDLGNKKGYSMAYGLGDGSAEQYYYAYKVHGYVVVVLTTKNQADPTDMKALAASVKFN